MMCKHRNTWDCNKKKIIAKIYCASVGQIQQNFCTIVHVKLLVPFSMQLSCCNQSILSSPTKNITQMYPFYETLCPSKQ